MKVVELQREGWRDTVKALRKIADHLKLGGISLRAIEMISLSPHVDISLNKGVVRCLKSIKVM